MLNQVDYNDSKELGAKKDLEANMNVDNKKAPPKIEDQL